MTRSGWCHARAEGWSHARCHLEGCPCWCHTVPEPDPVVRHCPTCTCNRTTAHAAADGAVRGAREEGR